MYSNYKTGVFRKFGVYLNLYVRNNMTSDKVAALLLFSVSLTLVSALLPGVSKYYFNKYNHNQDPILSKFREYLSIDTSSHENIGEFYLFVLKYKFGNSLIFSDSS